MIVVVDTNVIVSGVINPNGAPAAVLRMIAGGRLTPAFDLRILQEYRAVLLHPRFGFRAELVEELLELFEKEGLSISPAPLPAVLPDPGDLPFLEVAAACGAFAIVTGNKKHFPPESIPGIKILSPAELLDINSTAADGGTKGRIK
jgi:putative PIN family toxin of toxin-antitoxin system